ncbi:MAG TPA: MFS transporter, partial [Acidimicrobiales bacterium]|nr:MFS transporter [Acidimicrobiales bacterium]
MTAPDDGRLVTPLFALIVAAGTCYFLSIATLLPTLPRYVEEELDGGGLAVGAVVGAFAVSAALVRPTVGRLGDIVGRRTMSLAGAGFVAVATIPLGLVPALWYLVLLRLVAGLGEACFFIGAATAAQDLAPDHRRGEAASLFSVTIYGGLAFGPLIGEQIYTHLGPTETWLFAGGTSVVAFALSWFIPREMGRAVEPPPRRGLLHPAAVLPGSVLLLGVTGFTGFAAFLPLYVDEIGQSGAGPFLLLYGVLVLAIRLIGSKVPDRLGPVRTSTYALVAVTVGLLCIGLIPTATAAWVATVMLAIGMSLLFPALFTAAVNGAPASERSHAVGTFSLFFDLSQGLGAPALGLAVAV